MFFDNNNNRQNTYQNQIKWKRNDIPLKKKQRTQTEKHKKYIWKNYKTITKIT